MDFSDDDSRSFDEDRMPYQNAPHQQHPSIGAKTLRFPVDGSEDSGSLRGDESMDMDDSMDMDANVSMDTTNNGHGHGHYDSDDEDDNKNGDGNDNDNDETDNDDNDDDDDDSQNQVVMERPRGKVLRLPPRDDESSEDDDDDDDDIQVAAVVGDDNGENEDFSIAETSYAEEASLSFATPMKDNDGDDKEVAIAEVVMDGNESENSEVAPVVAEVVKKVRKKPGPKPKNKDGTKKTSSDKRKSSGDKRRKRPESGSKGDGHARESTISRDKLEAAQKARDILLSSIKDTPFPITVSHIIQNFGRVVVEKDSSKEPVFSNATSLFPVGFCCDRYEFSPVHGREIKLRCEILDKKELLANMKEEEPKVNFDGKKSKSKSKKGPLFRITWGQGVDELQDGKPFPFDLYSASSPLGGEVDTVAVPMGLDVAVVPEPGMRVKVRFDDDVWYHGTIKKAYKKEASKKKDDEKKKGTRSASKKGNKSHHVINIIYDDGMKEDIAFPDPDIILVAPGSERIDDGKKLDLNYVHGKPVMSVHGKSPLEAWANALIKLGLIDEVMYEKALESIKSARVEGMKEVKDRMDTLRRQRQEARARQLQKQKDNGDGSQSPVQIEDSKTKEFIEKDADEEVEKEPSTEGKEPSTEKEQELRDRAEELKAAYEVRFKESQKIAISLADSRIVAHGPFLSNPFYGDETQQKTWLTTIIKKEKSKMGSTGNKRKIVTPTDILDRNATFYNLEIEHLLEGLPGSEFCADYVFYDLRGNGASQYSFVHEVKLRKERERMRRKKRAKEKEAKDDVEREKQLKRKARDDEREERKKLKVEELDQQKRARQDERLSRLSTQVEERLFKEACFQRERVVLLASKLCGKEIARRKKASEAVTAYAVDNTAPHTENRSLSFYELPPLSKKIDLDIVRLHDFLITYKSFFEKQGVLPALPSLDELQQAIEMCSSAPATVGGKNKYLTLLNNIAVAMARPLTPFLIKTLSSALTTNINNDEEDQPKDETQRLLDPDDYAVTPSTWKEIVRLALIMDTLSEQGLTKIELTHVLRGYRSGGHPNSKEAKRIRRGEDSELVLRRQAMILNSEENSAGFAGNQNSIVVPAPCKPSVYSSHWTYYLHNIKALPSNAATGMKSNLRKAQKILKASSNDFGKADAFLSKIESNISLLDQIGTTYTSSSETIEVCKKVRKSVLRLLDKATGELFSSDEASEAIYRDIKIGSPGASKNAFAKLALSSKPRRERGGVPGEIFTTASEYKKQTQEKEVYMSDAIKLKEEQERKKKSSEDDDDDDDEDEDDEMEEKKDTPEDAKSPQKPSSQEEKKNGLFKETKYDDFCADEPGAPELIRRCLAVLRNLCQSSPAETFLYPVDPQSNLRYYESVVTPMSLHNIGKYLQEAGKRIYTSESEIESVVALFARKVRLIGKNVSCFTPVGGPLISTAEELLRIFERLLFDWILAPADKIPTLETLDDDRCVEYDSSDDESMVLLCDGCDGKYNMSRLKPPLRSVPKGDWYCPRCRSGYCWALVDPRLGQEVKNIFHSADGTTEVKGEVTECRVCVPEDEAAKSLNYVILYEQGFEELWTLNEVDKVLKEAGTAIEPINCLEAVTESLGYGCGADSRLVRDVLPIQLDPNVSESAAQRFLASSVFRDTVLSCAALLVNDVDGMSSSEWIRVLNLLMMKCMSSDTLQEAGSKIEDAANSELSEKLAEVTKIKAAEDVLPQLTDDEIEDTNSSATGNDGEQGKSTELSDEDKELKRERIANMKAAKDRQKKRDDVFLANAIKRQIKPSVASLEEDQITMVVNNALVSNDVGIDYATSRCPSQLCDFCGLSDVSVGTPLVRYPNEIEWAENASNLLRKRNTSLIAEVDTSDSDDNSIDEKSRSSAIMLVSLKLGGEIVCDDDEYLVDAPDQDMSGYGLVPRNKEGFQRELKARADGGPPVLTGSLSVHDCCAQAAHKARIDRMIQHAKNRMSEEIEREQGNKCGKGSSIGIDPQGRSYWKLKSSPDSLFVLEKSSGREKMQCHRFSSSEAIASVIKCLGKYQLAMDLKRLYPQAFKLLKSGEWSELLQKKAFKLFQQEEEKSADVDMGDVFSANTSVGSDFNAGDEVLVQSVASGVLWDANIVAVAKQEEGGSTIAYRVHYKEWSSRFDEWVSPSRVLEVDDENIEKQQKCASKIVDYDKDLSTSLRDLKASAYLCSPNRAKGFAKMPDFRRLLDIPPSASLEDNAIQELKTALLLVEAALPNGSLKAVWKTHTALYWRSMVSKSNTPGNIMGCLVLLENAISKEWLRPNCEHLISCLPRHWKSINEASVSSIALRLGTLDRGLKYGMSKDDNGHWDSKVDK